MKQLYQHQVEAIDYAERVVHPAFFMEMRLGKNLTLIRFAKRQELRCCLVIGTVTTLGDLEDELASEDEICVDLKLHSRARREELLVEAMESGQRIWVLATYGLLRSMPVLGELPWDLTALDESRNIANPKAQVTKICLKKFGRVKHRVVMCGMPNPQSDMELFNQIAFLDGHFMDCKNYWEFRERYFHPVRFEWKPKKGMKDEIKACLHRRAFVKLRTDVGMGSEKVRKRRAVVFTDEQKALYEAVARDYAYKLESGEWNETQWATEATLWFQRIVGGFSPDGQHLSDSKLNELIALLEGELTGQQVVVWFKFREELSYVSAKLRGKGMTVGEFHGGTKDRKGVKRQFHEGEFRVLLCTSAAKAGIDLSPASTAIYYSQDWSVDTRIQTEDRLVHPEKKEPVLLIDLVVNGTVDETISRRILGHRFSALQILKKEVFRFVK